VAKPVPFDPEKVKYGEAGAAMVALAGPFTNLFLAALGGLLIQLGIGIGLGVLELFVYINIVFFVFNMIPFPPLDGSRLLYAVAPDPVRKAMMQIEAAGMLTLVVFVLLLLPFIGPVITYLTEGIFNFLVR
jgi:Zn-dependent protease